MKKGVEGTMPGRAWADSITDFLNLVVLWGFGGGLKSTSVHQGFEQGVSEFLGLDGHIIGCEHHHWRFFSQLSRHTDGLHGRRK